MNTRIDWQAQNQASAARMAAFTDTLQTLSQRTGTRLVLPLCLLLEAVRVWLENPGRPIPSAAIFADVNRRTAGRIPKSGLHRHLRLLVDLHLLAIVPTPPDGTDRENYYQPTPACQSLLHGIFPTKQGGAGE